MDDNQNELIIIYYLDEPQHQEIHLKKTSKLLKKINKFI